MSKSQFLKPLPHSTEAEKTTLGALLLDGETMIDVAELLSPADFYDSTHRSIFAAMLALYEERTPIDFITVNARLENEQKIQDLGGSAFLADLAAAVPTASHIRKYAGIVREMSLRRSLAKTADALKAAAMEGEQSTTELVEQAEQAVLKLSHRGTVAEARRLIDIGSERYDHYCEAYESDDPSAFAGIPTGFQQLDALLGGLMDEQLIVIAARPSMGKTALAMNIARNAAQRGKHIGFFSLEMAKEQLLDRLVASDLGVETHHLNRGTIAPDAFESLGGVMDGFKSLPIFIDDDQDTNLTGIRSRARRLQMMHDVELLVIDYLQLIGVTGPVAKENATQKMTYVSKQVKKLARELQCPVIALSQLSREVEHRKVPIPILSDLRESGAIEQDADVVLMLYREGYYDSECDNPMVTDVLIRKNRQGPTGRVELDFEAERMRFVSIEEGTAKANDRREQDALSLA